LKEIIGKNVKKFRKLKGYNKSELARLVGYSHPSPIYGLESGKQGVSAEKLKQIADILNVSVNDLTKGYSGDDESFLETKGNLSEKEELERLNKELGIKIKALTAINKRINSILQKLK